MQQRRRGRGGVRWAVRRSGDGRNGEAYFSAEEEGGETDLRI